MVVEVEVENESRDLSLLELVTARVEVTTRVHERQDSLPLYIQDTSHVP